MTLLITGGLGYIGTQYALSNGYNHGSCVLLDKRKDERFAYQRDTLSDQFTILDGDLGDFPTVRKIIEEWEIEDVLHLGALTNAAESSLNPGAYRMGNTEATKALIHACKGTSVKSFTFASSAAVYGSHNPKAQEEDRLDPANTYGMTKMASEEHLDRFIKETDGLGYCSLRFFNVIGANRDLVGGKTHGNDLLSAILGAAIERKPFNLYGDGRQYRDFVSIRDVCSAIDVGIEMARRKVNMPFNVGTGIPKQVIDVYMEVQDALNLDIELIQHPARRSESTGFVADIDRAVSAGIKTKPIDWHKEVNLVYAWERLSRAGCPHLEYEFDDDASD